MARTRAFDESEALALAMGMFWENGYEATSVRELAAGTGLSSSSLYAAFGDKHDVYLAALDRYRAAELEEVRRSLEATRPVRETLRSMFADLIDGLMAGGQRGSFTLNAAIEVGARDPAVAARLRAHFDDIRDLLSARLAAAQAGGEVSDRHPPDELAHFLLFGLYSLATVVKVYPDRLRLEQLAALTLSVLDC